MSTTEETPSYTLEVPATRASIMELVTKIMEDHPNYCPCHNPDTRVKLAFGTAGLICYDERERAEHQDKVKLGYALNTLRDAYYAVEERQEGQAAN
jgi:hypothetical protein